MNAKTNNCVTTLMSAALIGDIDTVKVMLDRGADVNAQDRIGWTALKYAEWKHHTDIAQLLRKAGAKELALSLPL